VKIPSNIKCSINNQLPIGEVESALSPSLKTSRASPTFVLTQSDLSENTLKTKPTRKLLGLVVLDYEWKRLFEPLCALIHLTGILGHLYNNTLMIVYLREMPSYSSIG